MEGATVNVGEREREKEREREGERERERERGVTKGWMNARGKSLCHPLLQKQKYSWNMREGMAPP
jgi:hypothetical protein